MAAISEVDAELLSRDAELRFQLNKQHLVELIRAGDPAAAVVFAQRTLGDLDDSRQQQQVDAAMALLLYPEDLAKAPMSELAAQSARSKLAILANQKLLEAHGHPADLQLEFLWKLATYADSQLPTSAPKVTDV